MITMHWFVFDVLPGLISSVVGAGCWVTLSYVMHRGTRKHIDRRLGHGQGRR